MMWRVCTAALLLLQMATAHASLTVHIQQTLEKGLDLAVANFSGPAAGEPLGGQARPEGAVRILNRAAEKETCDQEWLG